jgi:hypothetical protein
MGREIKNFKEFVIKCPVCKKNAKQWVEIEYPAMVYLPPQKFTVLFRVKKNLCFLSICQNCFSINIMIDEKGDFLEIAED